MEGFCSCVSCRHVFLFHLLLLPLVTSQPLLPQADNTNDIIPIFNWMTSWLTSLHNVRTSGRCCTPDAGEASFAGSSVRGSKITRAQVKGGILALHKREAFSELGTLQAAGTTCSNSSHFLGQWTKHIAL